MGYELRILQLMHFFWTEIFSSRPPQEGGGQ